MKDIRPEDWQLICELEQFARSHTANGEPRTADLLTRAANRMRELCKPPESWLQPTQETPADLVGALQDKVHTDAGPFRAGRAVKETGAHPFFQQEPRGTGPLASADLLKPDCDCTGETGCIGQQEGRTCVITSLTSKG